MRRPRYHRVTSSILQDLDGAVILETVAVSVGQKHSNPM